jgi:hypothetical protein
VLDRDNSRNRFDKKEKHKMYNKCFCGDIIIKKKADIPSIRIVGYVNRHSARVLENFVF